MAYHENLGGMRKWTGQQFYHGAEREKSIELLKKNNAGGIYSNAIGMVLALDLKRYEEAEPFLSEALLLNLIGLVNSVSGYALVLSHRKDYEAARKMLSGFIDYLRQFKEGEKTDFTDKIMASMVIAMAHVYTLEKKTEEAKECLRKVLAFVRQFDAAPDYGIQTFRYPAFHQDAVFSDGFGVSAAESAETLLNMLSNQKLSKMWKEISMHA